MNVARPNIVAFVFAVCTAFCSVALAQDVPGIEICTVEKTMERRTSCLQSNVNFLKTSLDKVQADARNRQDAANREIVSLKSTVAALQKTLADLQTEADKTKKTPAPAAPPAAPAK